MPELVGDRIRKARLRCGLSGAALARRIGISRQHLHAIESNTTQDPGVTVVEKIAEALNIHADYLLSGRQHPRRSLAELDISELKPTELAPV